MRNFLNWITGRDTKAEQPEVGKAAPVDMTAGKASSDLASDAQAAPLEARSSVAEDKRDTMSREQFDDAMESHRYMARIMPAKSPAEVATALKSLDAAVFESELSGASTERRGSLASFRRHLRSEDDPLSETALKFRKGALSLGHIQDQGNRDAMMQVIAFAEVSAGQEQEAINTRFFELTSPSNYVPHIESEKTLVATLQDALAPHVATIQAEGEQSGFDKTDRAILGMLVDKEGRHGEKPDLNTVREANAMLVAKGGLMREDMRTDLLAVHRVANVATRVRQPRESDVELV